MNKIFLSLILFSFIGSASIAAVPEANKSKNLTLKSLPHQSGKIDKKIVTDGNCACVPNTSIQNYCPDNLAGTPCTSNCGCSAGLTCINGRCTGNAAELLSPETQCECSFTTNVQSICNEDINTYKPHYCWSSCDCSYGRHCSDSLCKGIGTPYPSSQ